MGIEIERKFLVIGDAWRQPQPVHFRQGYLNRDRQRTVRVRVADAAAWLTIKGPTADATRAEFEYVVPRTDAAALLALADGPVLEKYRHHVACGGFTWDVDEFLGANAGLVVAEIELARADQPFPHPPWLGREVTGEARYYNANLAVTPYSMWRERG